MQTTVQKSGHKPARDIYRYYKLLCTYNIILTYVTVCGSIVTMQDHFCKRNDCTTLLTQRN